MTELTSSQTNHLTVAVDAMGGDQAPQAIVAGAVAAARALPSVGVLLVGDESRIRQCLATLGAQPANLAIQHASQVVEMCDAPGVAIRQKSDSSISVGMRLVRSGQAQAFISAGNSGAMMAAAVLILKPQPGIDRPAIATLIPTRRDRAVLLDAGATTDCKPLHLVQFARLGAAYAASALERPQPRVGLLSIGEEPTKGDELTKETHKLLRDGDLNFVGNVEPKEMLRGEVDVVVCDGFVGNMVLKTLEGFGEFILTELKTQVMHNWLQQLGALLVAPAIRAVKKRMDYAEVGGALLLGVNGVVLIGHGRSDARAIANAVRTAAQAVERRATAVPAAALS